jgi:GNAT superfamily N-acetyltransferase
MIRAATIDDAEVIARIHVHAWQVAYTNIIPADFLAAMSVEQRTAAWRQLLKAGDSLTLVHEEEGLITGWINAGAARDADIADSDEIRAIYVAPAHWRRGIGRQLMQRAEAVMLPARDLSLWVLRDNDAALRFYAAMQYHPDGNEKMIARGGKSLSEIRLRKQR